WACAGLAGLAFLAVALLVREAPPAGPPRRMQDDARAVLAFTVSRPLLSAMALAFVSFGVMLGLRGLWGGPWLMQVEGFSRIEAGNLLLLAAAALVVGPFLAGLLARVTGRLVLLLAAGHLVAAGMIVALVLVGGMRVAWLDGLLLVGFGLSITTQVCLFALVQGRVTPDVAGRALSAMNIYFFGGAAFLQGLTGLAAAWGGVAAALLTLAVALVLGSLVFLWLERGPSIG
ncbi:MAG: MFS transporter, partial [Rubritepida sp.]|nr:MFS transporter [Rubritepida sp.]